MKAALFDIDGTLVRRNPERVGPSPKRRSILESVENIFGVGGADYHLIDFEGLTDKQMIYGAAALVGVTAAELDNGWEEFEADLHLRYQKQMEAVEPGEFIALPGAIRLLGSLAEKNIALGLATGNLLWAAEIKLKSAGIITDFAGGGYGDYDPERSEIVRRAIAELGAEPEQTVLIGDTPRDVQAALDNKIYSVAVATGAFNREQLADAGADLVLESLDKSEKLKALF